MPTITRIEPQRRNADRRSVHLDGIFVFGCSLNVVARFRLREGLVLSAEQVLEIQAGEVRQECLDAALRALGTRLHSRAELQRKLMRKEFGSTIIEGVLDDLQRMDYLDDARFALAKASAAARRKLHGPRRAMIELRRSGVGSDAARQATNAVYEDAEQTCAIARQLVEKHRARLSRLEPTAARRRLIGMLQRRGFDFNTIEAVLASAKL